MLGIFYYHLKVIPHYIYSSYFFSFICVIQILITLLHNDHL
jgi:hypothetical protein